MDTKISEEKSKLTAIGLYQWIMARVLDDNKQKLHSYVLNKKEESGNYQSFSLNLSLSKDEEEAFQKIRKVFGASLVNFNTDATAANKIKVTYLPEKHECIIDAYPVKQVHVNIPLQTEHQNLTYEEWIRQQTNESEPESPTISVTSKVSCNRFVIYDNMKIYATMLKGNEKGKFWPCTTKDLFMCSGNCMVAIIREIMLYFGQSNRLWLDLVNDFDNKSAYSSIPLDLIWNCHSRAELLQKYYHFSLSRNNKESIGKGIFLANVRRVVNENELQHLFGYDPGNIFIGRAHSDLAYPLTAYIMAACKDIQAPIKLPRGSSLHISGRTIHDAITMSFQLRKKIPLHLKTAKQIYEWHQALLIEQRKRTLPTVLIPHDSPFKLLDLPEPCIRLTSKKMFADEGEVQNNCVASYIYKVNDDLTSIWSMRKDDGTRNTIEICIRKNQDGNFQFYIEQLYGFSNSDAPSEDWALIENALAQQQSKLSQWVKKVNHDPKLQSYYRY